jgi:hypothetical protein
MLKKTPTDTRYKLIAELRSLEKKRLELLGQTDNLPKPTKRGAERTTVGQIRVAKFGGQTISRDSIYPNESSETHNVRERRAAKTSSLASYFVLP